MNSFRWIGLSADESRVELTRFKGVEETSLPEIAAIPADMRVGLRCCAGIDVETTGLDFRSCTIIEVGIRLYYFRPATGEIVAYGQGYSALQEIDEPLSPEVVRITGITDADLKGQAIDWQLVDKILEQAQLIIAHNSGFDRPFVEKFSPQARKTPWACSLTQVDWQQYNFPTRKLEILCQYHGFFARAHRALVDVEAMMHLLSFNSPNREGYYYLTELLECARKPLLHVVAAHSPFEAKDLLKVRGYSWDPKERFWHRKIFKDEWESERDWIEEKVYHGEFRGYTNEIPLHENFRAQ